MHQSWSFRKLKRTTSAPMPSVSSPLHAQRTTHVTSDHEAKTEPGHQLSDAIERELEMMQKTFDHLQQRSDTLNRSESVEIERFRAENPETSSNSRRKSLTNMIRRITGRCRATTDEDNEHGARRQISTRYSNAESTPTNEGMMDASSSMNHSREELQSNSGIPRNSAGLIVRGMPSRSLMPKAAKCYAAKVRNERD